MELTTMKTRTSKFTSTHLRGFKLAALIDMYPKRTAEELLGELVAAALEEVEASFPYVQGRQVIATDEEGDPLYEDVGSTPRFLSLSRQHLHNLSTTSDDSDK